MEKIITWLIIAVCVSTQVLGIFMWIKYGSSNEWISVYIISIMLTGCTILWSFNFQSAIRLNLSKYQNYLFKFFNNKNNSLTLEDLGAFKTLFYLKNSIKF